MLWMQKDGERFQPLTKICSEILQAIRGAHYEIIQKMNVRVAVWKKGDWSIIVFNFEEKKARKFKTVRKLQFCIDREAWNKYMLL